MQCSYGRHTVPEQKLNLMAYLHREPATSCSILYTTVAGSRASIPLSLIFFPDGRGICFLFSAFTLRIFLNFGARLFFRRFVVSGH